MTDTFAEFLGQRVEFGALCRLLRLGHVNPRGFFRLEAPAQPIELGNPHLRFYPNLG